MKTFSETSARSWLRPFSLFVCLACFAGKSLGAAEYQLFARSNLVAWCIVPFDAKKRTPPERAEMVKRVGLPAVAYDWRAEHVPQFEQEILEYQKQSLRYFAFWGQHDEAYRLFEKHKLAPQFWVMIPKPAAATQTESVKEAAAKLLPTAQRAAKLGSQVGLYNHGGWGGEPENMVAVCRELREAHGVTNVGIIYNLHHGHDHVDRLEAALALMKPHLLCVNLNGMTRGGDKTGKKIIPLGQGELDLKLMKLIRDSGWRGSIGILGHTENDAEEQLRDNLDGLDWLLPQLDGKPAGPKPTPRTERRTPIRPDEATPRKRAGSETGAPSGLASLSPAFGKALNGGLVVEGKSEYRALPLTIECRAKLNSPARFNILVASDTKQSAEHWEIFLKSGSGEFSVFMPGRGGAMASEVNICDDQWHALAAILEPARVRLFVDGKLVLDKPASPLKGAPQPGGLAFGRLVEGGLGCDGLVDDVRLTKGVREINGVPTEPLKKDERTIGLWNFDELASAGSSRGSEPPSSSTKKAGKKSQRLVTSSPTKSGVDYWAIEDAAARAKLPLYQTIPAAKTSELTPALPEPKPESFRSWSRSLGDSGSRRYSALTQINRDNVKQLEVAWTYNSKDGKGNIQANPVIVDGVMFAPTVGDFIVAVDAMTGKELWRFKPEAPARKRLEDNAARRGLVFWRGDKMRSPRLIFPTGNWLYALDPKTGRPIAEFGENGRAPISGASVVAPAVFQNVIVVPGFQKNVFGYDVGTGKLLWTFHTIPQPGEFGYDTWDQPNQGANSWGGMALDEQRGIAFITTGSPKPNFIGTPHHGDNLFANCVIALDARTGKRLWHFQEIRHDIWDLDLPAPPNLVTVTREGRRVDAVAAVSKIGNTLLLDRVTGQPLFPFRLRRAPTSKLPGEQTAPYQPDMELPQPFARQVFSTNDVTDISPEARMAILNKVKFANTGWFEAFEENKPTIFYGLHGGAEWTGAAVDAASGWLYVTGNELPWQITVTRAGGLRPKNSGTPGEMIYKAACMTCHGELKEGVGVSPPLLALDKRMKDADVLALMKTGRNLMPVAPALTAQQQKDLMDFIFDRDLPADVLAKRNERGERPSYVFAGYPKLLDPEGYPGVKPPWGTLNAIDLNTGRLVWKVPLGEYPELTARGIPKTGTENFGGAMVTAGGLVFAGGTRDECLCAFDAKTGAELWKYKLPFGGVAPPATYEVNGRQYVVIAATGGGKLGLPTGDAYVAFALPKK